MRLLKQCISMSIALQIVAERDQSHESITHEYSQL